MKSNNYIFGNEVEWVQVNEKMRRQVLGYDERMMLVKIEFLTGGVGVVHAHEHHQCSYVVSGKFEFEINGEKRVVKAGDGLYMGSNVPHGVVCLEEGILIDTFNPVRQDFL